MKANIYNSQGTKTGNLDLPSQFNESIRTDLIQRAFLAIRANKRQSYGAYPHAGERVSAKLSRRRRDYKTSYGKAISRAPRKTIWRRGRQMGWIGAFAPGTYKGRRANPPKGSKLLGEKINIKENRKAIRSALAAVANENFVKARGHEFKEFPLILENDIYNLKKTSELVELLIKLGLENELQRLQIRKVRAGQGSKRGRKYQNKKGPLFVIGKNSPIVKILKSINGIDCTIINDVNVELLAPGGVPGRLTFFTKDAISMLEDKKLFFDNVVQKEIKKEPVKKTEIKETKKPIKEVFDETFSKKGSKVKK